jgi:hypothetical protein
MLLSQSRFGNRGGPLGDAGPKSAVGPLTHSAFASIVYWRSMYLVTLHRPHARDDEGARLFAVYEASCAKEHSAASQLLYPRRSLAYETYMKLVGDLRTIRTECNEQLLAVRAHHNKMKERIMSAGTNP